MCRCVNIKNIWNQKKHQKLSCVHQGFMKAMNTLPAHTSD
jgi:hypothetical protein